MVHSSTGIVGFDGWMMGVTPTLAPYKGDSVLCIGAKVR